MKFKTTKKEIMRMYADVISLPYEAGQSLLSALEPSAYTCGAYGWNSDIYTMHGIAVSTGYRPFGNRHPDYAKVKEYDKKAAQIKAHKAWKDETKEKKLLDLVWTFMLECVDE